MSSIRHININSAQNRPARRRFGSPAGFTLIELLVVIAIIALLAAILFPVFAAAREKARQSSCASNMRQLALAVIQYAEDVDGKYPPYLTDGGGAAPGYINPVMSTTPGMPAQEFVVDDGNGGGFHYVSWMDSIFPFVKSTQVFVCPSVNKPVDVTPYAGTFGVGVAGNGYKWMPAVYGVNGFLFGFPDAYDPTLNHSTASQGIMESVASKIMLIHNTREISAWTPSRFYAYAEPNSSLPYQPYPTHAEMMRRFFPHSDGQVIAYADGHVEWKEKPDIVPFTCDGNDDCAFWQPSKKAE